MYYKLTLTGFMNPSRYPNQKVIYQVTSGRGVFLEDRGDDWTCVTATPRDLFPIERGQGHFFCSPDGEMKVAVFGSPALLTLRQAVEAPASFVVPGKVMLVEDGSVVCETPIGIVPPFKVTAPIEVGQTIRIKIVYETR